ncbi:MAG TPA: ABC transporter substrate-binding protein [Syntrophomonadaceae bacterium]|nr:ABC transporter substrate-binding protein [Syntrophomonadaceae bacterium]
MKRVLASLITLLMVIGLAGCAAKTETPAPQAEKVNIGIVQIVQHPALDSARQGFLDALADKGYKQNENLVVDYQNAQGEQANLQTISQKFVQDKPQLVLAIATPSAVAMANATTEIPILITAVTDPVSAKLVKSNEKPDTNVTGTSDMNPVADQLKLIKEIIPTAQKIGIIYNSSEVNSQVQADIADQAAPGLGVEMVKVTVTASNEVMQAAQSMVGRVDAIYVPTDNMVVSALASVVKVGEDNDIPVFGAESNTVENGAVATVGIDYYQLGRMTGDMAVRVLKGEKPQDMAIQQQQGSDLILNLKAAQNMGVTVPEAVIAKAKTVIK